MPSQRGQSFRNLLQSREAMSFGLGVGTAALGLLLWPVIKKASRPVAKSLVAGAMAAGDRAKSAMAELKEGLEDVVAEAQYERMQESGKAGGPTPASPPL
ncbi:MAG: hypothetical protein ACYC5Y_04250 [Symbiobacteriia bacterium]